MGGSRAERYGSGIIAELSEQLTRIYGKGFDKRSLYRYVQFYSEWGGWGSGYKTGDPMVASYDWLTVKGEKFKDGLTITAAPNTSKSPRFLTIEIGTGATEYGYIKVRQNGKTE